MSNTHQPAQFDWATELSDAQGRVTLSEQEAKEIGARLRSMGAKLKSYEDLGDAANDMQLLRMGYAAARLEIESLRARSAEPAGEYPALPKPGHRGPDGTGSYFDSFTSDQMRAYADATCAMRAAQPAVDALAEAEYFIDNPSAWSNFDQRASDAIAAVCKAFRAARSPADSVLEDAALESEYRRGYRHGYEQRDAEVRGALA